MNSQVEQLHSRAWDLFDKFKQGEGTSYVDQAIDLDREALGLCPPPHDQRFAALTYLASHLSGRSKQLGGTRELDEAIVLSREAVALCPQGHLDRPTSLYHLAHVLSTRHEQFGAMQDLDEAIVLNREALSLQPEKHSNCPSSLNNLAVDLISRYNQIGAMQDLDEAIVLSREALSLWPTGHPYRSSSLGKLAMALSTRYNLLGAMEELDESIALGQEVLSLRPEGHPDRPNSLNNLAVSFHTRFGSLGAMQDLDKAIALHREVVSLWPKGHPNHSTSLGALATYLFTRYTQLGAMQDFDEALALNREALGLLPKGHPYRCIVLSNLATNLRWRHKQFGAMQDLDEAIGLDRESLCIQPEGHPERSTSLNNLATNLRTRHKQFGIIQDLDEAIDLNREALILLPKEHPGRSSSLNNLAVDLCTRYEQLGARRDLHEAIVLNREELGLPPRGHPNRCISLNNLAGGLSTRYKQLGIMQDLDEAIALNREALIHRPEGHPNRCISLNNLASNLHTRYQQLGSTQDLDEAIVLDREALALRPQQHPERSRCLDCLARDLLTRFIWSRNLHDLEEVFHFCAQLAPISQYVSQTDISAVRAWVFVAEEFQHPTLLLAYETALEMLIQHLATLPSLPQHHVILKRLTSSLAVDAFSACLRSYAPARAVELVEQGRGVFWTQLTRLQSPLHDVIESGPVGKKLADEFSRLALHILNAVNAPGADQRDRLWSLYLEMQAAATNIRQLPGLSRFLLPPLFSDLQYAASGGPVIILNASEYSCDALIVFHDRDPVHIPLQISHRIVRDLSTELPTLTARAKRADMTKELAYFLRKVWNQIVSPVIDLLQTITPFGSRIWWCPTADFTTLPLHAAGPYRKGQQNLPELYISSYTPTLTALIRARRCNASAFATQEKRFVAIGQTKAVGENELPSVGAELANIGRHVSDFAKFTCMDRDESCFSRVVEELGRNEWVHLACHGLPNPSQPFKSAFALHDGRFTIERIIGCKLKNPEFAYLSACHTTVGDKDSPDEVIHLASAMQFIGFRSVIGTMWEVDDGETNKITSTFYRYMVDDSGRLDHTRAAYALNKTMKVVNIPFDQRILYIHFGA